MQRYCRVPRERNKNSEENAPETVVLLLLTRTCVLITAKRWRIAIFRSTCQGDVWFRVAKTRPSAKTVTMRHAAERNNATHWLFFVCTTGAAVPSTSQQHSSAYCLLRFVFRLLLYKYDQRLIRRWVKAMQWFK